MNSDDSITKQPKHEPESFEELRERYDDARESAASLGLALREKRAQYNEQIAAIEASWAREQAELIREETRAAEAAEAAEAALRNAILEAYALDPSSFLRGRDN